MPLNKGFTARGSCHKPETLREVVCVWAVHFVTHASSWKHVGIEV
jgi:hypothetical protein